MSDSFNDLYKLYLAQVAAESYLEDQSRLGGDKNIQRRSSEFGRSRDKKKAEGYSHLTPKQLDEFLATYDVLHQTSGNSAPPGAFNVFSGGPAANSGFSATLLRS